MKRVTTIRLLALLMSAVFEAIPYYGTAQVFAFKEVPQQIPHRSSAPTMQLKDALLTLKAHYKADIVFADHLVKDKMVPTNPVRQNGQLEKDLNEILKLHGLGFKKSKTGSYIIVSFAGNSRQRTFQIKGSDEKPLSQSISTSVQTTVDAPGVWGKTATTDVLDHTIYGRITDAESKDPLPGVNVILKGTQLGTTSDVNGNFTITVSDDQKVTGVLIFSFVGYESNEVPIGNLSRIDVGLRADLKTLEEVVVVGYGVQKKANVVGAITTISNESITSSPVGNVSNALAGKLPGATFMQSSGEPGSDQATIRIRGNSTLGNNSPLVIIDGVPGRDLNSIHADDIANISVLKDASAGIYGARAANGVILVTTKRGRANSPIKVDYSFYEGRQSPVKLPKMVDAATYARMIRENQSYRGVDETNMLFSLEDVEKYESGAFPWTHPNTDWFKEALRRNSATRHHNLSVSGGGSKINYFTSFGTQFDDGIYTNSSTFFKRYNLRTNIDFNVNEYLGVGIDLSGVKQRRHTSAMSSANVFQTIRRSLPTQPALYPNGLPGPDIEYGYQPMVMASDEVGFNNYDQYRVNSIFNLTLRNPWIKQLTVSTYFAYDMVFTNSKLFEKPFYLYSFNKDAYLAAGNTGVEDGSAFLIANKKALSEPRLTDNFGKSESNTFNFKVDYQKTFDENHNFSAFIAYEQFESKSESINAFRRFFVSDQLPYLFAGGDEEKDNSGNVGFDARQNYFGRISYDYKGRYLAQFSFRRDGSVNFSKEAGRWGNFPSLLLGWVPSESNWWKTNLNRVDFFKLRASWGKLGNDLVNPFQYLTSYTFSTGLPLGENRSYVPSIVQAGAPNPFITWEVANMYNIGIEGEVFKSKLYFDIDFFYERRSNILVKRNSSVPSFTGITLPDENFGIVDNYGFESVAGFREKKGAFSYELKGNFNFVRNRIREFDEPTQPVPWQVRTGKPHSALLIYKSLGVFQDQEHIDSYPHLPSARPGDIIIEDYDKDGEITARDQQLIPMTTTPEITFGLEIKVSYKNWSLNALIQGHGRAIRNIYTDTRAGTAGNYYQFEADGRWTPENTNASKPRAYQWMEEYWRGTHITDYNYTDVSYARVRNVQLIFRVPAEISDKVWLKDAKLIFAAQNPVLLYSGNKIMDPEVGGMGSYPIMKTYSFGASISF